MLFHRITGIRRSGKSYLLFRLFKKYLVEHYTDEKHIISVELDRLEHKEYRQPLALLKHIDSLICDEKLHYVLLDEVQLLDDFEDVLNSLLRRENVDVYVTGSNSKFLSVNVNIRMYNFDDVQCTVIPSVAYGFVTGMNLQLC